MNAATNRGLYTRVLLSKPGELGNDRLLIGRSVTQTGVQKQSEKLYFKPLQIFGFVRWRGDRYGTQTWRVVVAQAGCRGERLTRIPGVDPGAHLLLHAFGKTRAKRALRVIDMLSEAHVLHEIAPAYWRHVHLQISKNEQPEPYDAKMFEALARARSVL
ncbi:MAG: DUF2840 domain-containing protein, partial [Henriciella sp.]|nr:DUF2840 domain-containing protein [Henriciella sp.]